MSAKIRIGDAAKQSGVNIQTFRYYERIGLLEPSYKAESGYRYYDQESIKKVQFVKRFQQLGFTLRDIRTLLGLSAQKESACDSVRKRAEKQLRSVEEKIDQMNLMRDTLKRLIKSCEKREVSDSCPILDCMEC